MDCDVSFVDKGKGIKTKLVLCNKYTLISNENSGEGLSWFYSYLEKGISTGSIKVSVEGVNAKFSLANTPIMDVALGVREKFVLLLDEPSMLEQNIIKRMNESNHMYILLDRALPLSMRKYLGNTYHLCRTETGYYFYQ